MTIADNLQTLIDCKADMKSAIEERGVTVSGGLSTYADAIREIEISNVSIDGFDWWFPNGTCFYGSAFVNAPLFDTSNFISFKYMFEDCENLLNVPAYNTSKVTDFSGAFSNCISLKTVELLDLSNCEHSNGMFFNTESLETLSGLINYGKKEDTPNLDLRYSVNLTHDSVINVFNCLYDRASAGLSVGKINLDYNVIAQLLDAEKAIATNKGWTIV